MPIENNVQIKYLLIILCFFTNFGFNVYADDQWVKKTANHPTWHKLLKYEASSIGPTQFVSAIHDAKFFLATDGINNPQAELVATLNALLNASTPLGDQHPQCRFPARYLWLKDIAPPSLKLPDTVACPAYDAWRFHGATESISVVFATGYLNNPASFYGHTLLKMNSGTQRKTVNIEDISVNYGAIVPSNEDPLSYIVKGIFGGYDAGFSHTEYYFHTHNYGENELRDLWEYELDLSKAQVDFILAHVWEVLGKTYTYYFFRKNCSYRMAELLEIIPTVDIIPNNPLFIMPQVLMTSIGEATLHDRPLVKSISYKESRQSKLYRAYDSLSHTQRDWLQRIVNDLSTLSIDDFKQLEMETQVKVVNTLMHYQLYLTKKAPENNQHSENYRKVLQARFSLPSGKIDSQQPMPTPPNKSRPPSRIAVGALTHSTHSAGISLHYRPAYYDELDADVAHVPWSALSMGEVKLHIDNDNVTIQQADLVAINSFNGKATNLPGDKQDAWRLKVGFRAQHLACKNCTVFYAEGALGHGFDLTANTKIITEYGAGLQEKSAKLGDLYVSAGARIISHVTPKVSLQVGSRYRVLTNGKTPNDRRFNLQLRYQLSHDQDIRLRFERHHATQLELQYGFYF